MKKSKRTKIQIQPIIFFFLNFKAQSCYIVFLAVLVTAYARPEPQRSAQLQAEEFPNEPYSFAYESVDPSTGMAFGHKESFDGVNTQGEYRVVLSDCRTQIVTYSVTPPSGYVADVKYEGTPCAPQPARLVKQG